jgi:hypothetical protein
MNRGSQFLTVASCLLVALWLPGAALGDEVDDENAERCISLNRIDRTHVLDDQQILFYMRGKDVYLNRLPRRCGGLSTHKRFTYRTSMSQLCNLDMITVLTSAGGGMMRGATCGLGHFYPITEDEADALRNPEPLDPEAEDLPSAEPEEVGETG